MREDLPIISESEYYHMEDVCIPLPYDEEKVAEDIDEFFCDFDGYIDYNSMSDVAGLVEIASNIPVYKKVILEESPWGSSFEAGEQVAYLDLSKEVSEYIADQQDLCR